MRTCRDTRKRTAGFTLAEMLVSLSMFLIVLYGVYLVYEVGEANYSRGSREWDAQSQARLALERMAREIRMAGYSAAGRLSDPVIIATNDTLSIHATEDETVGPQYITYGLRDCTGTAGSTLYRQASTTSYCGGDAFIEGVTALSFTYYELNGVMVPYSSPRRRSINSTRRIM